MTSRNWTQTSTPGYWLARDEFDHAVEFLEQGDSSGLARMSLTDSPPSDERVNLALVGDVLMLLAEHGISLPGYYHLREPGIIVNAISEADAEAASEPIRSFLRQATTETLAGGSGTGLSLYVGEPDVVRKGIEYILGMLEIPERFRGLLLFRG